MNRKLNLGFALGLFILLIDAAIPLVLIAQADRDRIAAAAAVQSQHELAELLSAYKDAETGQRGFLLTGQDRYLEPYLAGRATVTTLLPRVSRDLAASAVHGRRLSELLSLDQAEANYQQDSIRLRRIGAVMRVDPARGKALMDGLRLNIAAAIAQTRRQADIMNAAAQRSSAWAQLSLIAVTAVGVLLFATTYLLTRYAFRGQTLAQQAAEAANVQLEQQILLRDAALARVQTNTQRLNAVIATQTALAEAALDVQGFLDQVVQRILQLTVASGAAVEMLDGEQMVYQAVSGSLAGYSGLRLASLGSLSGQCVRESRLLVSEDTEQDPRVDLAAVRRVGARSMIVAPLLRAGIAVGVLKLVAPQPAAFTADDQQILQLMAGLLGAALGHQLQFERSELLAAERGHALAALEHELRRRETYEAELLHSRDRTEAILESSHDAFVCIDAQGRVTDWNAQAVNTFGWSKADVLGQSLEEFILPQRFRASHRRGLTHYLDTGEGPALNKRIEMPALHRDGHEIPVELSITVLHHGDEVAFSCFLHDISERKRDEAALAKQQATLRSITDSLPAFVAYLDREERFLYCNRRYLEAFGINPVGRTIIETVGMERYQQLVPHIIAVLDGRAAAFEDPINTPQGMRYIESRYLPQTDDNGQISGFYAIAWDVTERKQQEMAWQSLASMDKMTGLLNRACFLESLDMAALIHRSNGEAMAVLYLDIDHFKHINDRYGHAAGDAVLVAFANAIKVSVRGSDMVARFGGDEFCILLNGVKSATNAADVALKILDAARAPITFDDQTLSVTTSIGIAFAEKPPTVAESLLPLADAALYRAKQAGRNQYALNIVDPATVAND